MKTMGKIKSMEPCFRHGSMWGRTRFRRGLHLLGSLAGPGSFRSVKSVETRKNPLTIALSFV